MSGTLLTPPTRNGLLAEARHVVLPEGITSSGFPAVEATCREIGIYYDPWQQDLNRCILAKSSTGDYAADTVLMSICRQAGKTFDVGGLVFADSIIHPGTTTVWTAHRFPVSRESFLELRALASTPKMLPHVDPDEITSAAGNESIPFRNGSRIMFKARERGAIRGFTKVRRIVLDEAQILSEAAMADMAPTMNQATNPQVILMGTPPKPTDPSEVFVTMRTEALEGRSEGLLLVEFSADPDSDLDDRAAWAKANPSYPKRTSTKAIQRLRRLLTPDDFRREALGIWTEDDASVGLLDMSQWAKLGEVAREDQRPSPVAFAVAGSQDRQWFHIALAGLRADGKRHLQVIRSFRGATDVVPELEKLIDEWSPVGVAVNPAGPAGSLIADLQAKKIEPVLVAGRDEGQAVGMFRDGFDDGSICHQGETVLGMAVEHATLKDSGQSKVWNYRGDIDVAPLQAVTAALFALSTVKPKKRTGVVW